MIRTIAYNSIDDFTDTIISHYNNDEEFSIVCTLETAKAILRDILSWDCETINIALIDIADPDINGYDKEYQITFVDDDLLVEPARINGDDLPRFICEGDCISYIEDGVDEDFIDLMSNNLTIFSID